MRFFCPAMEVGECSAVSADDDDSTSFPNDDDVNNSHVCDDDGDVNESAAASSAATICLVQAVPDSYTITSVAQSVDEDGNVHFIAAADGTSVTPSELQFVEAATSASGATDDGSSGVVAPLKTTHIVIHKQSLNDSLAAGCGVKTPTTSLPPLPPLPPLTPATPRGRERGFRYQWDPSAFEPVLPVRCKNSSGELHKSRFGSGGRGRCIRLHDAWYTPSEFEAVCGRSNSKDWKRSIHYAGRTLQCLIEDNILQPHATSCTCAACCDDESVTGPVRLFVPYKRRKRDASCSDDQFRKKLSVTKHLKPSTATPAVAKSEEATAVLVSFSNGLTQPVRVGDAIETADSSVVQIIPDTEVGTIALTDQLLLTTTQPVTTTKVPNGYVSTLAQATVENPELKIWNQLEEMANSLQQQVQQLKLLIEQAKQQTNRDAIVEVMRAQFEKEKNEAVNAVRIEAQMQLARTIVEERQMKEIAMQQALAQARAELQEKFVGSMVEDKTSYSVWSSVPNVVTDPTVIDDLMEVGNSELVQEQDEDVVVVVEK